MCENFNKCRVQQFISAKTSKNMEHDNLLKVTRRFKRIKNFHFWRWRFCLSQNFSHSSMVVWIERFAKGNKLFFDYSNGPPSLGTIPLGHLVYIWFLFQIMWDCLNHGRHLVPSLVHIFNTSIYAKTNSPTTRNSKLPKPNSSNSCNWTHWLLVVWFHKCHSCRSYLS